MKKQTGKTAVMEAVHTHLRAAVEAIASQKPSLPPHPHPRPHLLTNSLASTAHQLINEIINLKPKSFLVHPRNKIANIEPLA